MIDPSSYPAAHAPKSCWKLKHARYLFAYKHKPRAYEKPRTVRYSKYLGSPRYRILMCFAWQRRTGHGQSKTEW